MSGFWEGEGGNLMDSWAKKMEEMQRKATEKLRKKAAEVQKMTEISNAWSLFETQNSCDSAGATAALSLLALACAPGHPTQLSLHRVPGSFLGTRCAVQGPGRRGAARRPCGSSGEGHTLDDGAFE